MDAVKSQDVAAVLTSVATYGGQLAAVFHNYALTAERIPNGFEGAINILDATVAVLKQVLTLVKDETEAKKLFSHDGFTYVNLLARECANTLAKVEPIIDEACLDRKERKALRKKNKKAASKKLVVEIDPLALKLDEKAFREKVESASWHWAGEEIAKFMERLYELQLHLLLIFEVVSVGELSKDMTSGKVDVQSIVTYHNRINRTADLIGIGVPEGRPTHHRRRESFSSSGSDSDSSTGSDSDTSSVMRKKKKRDPYRCGPPPGPPPPGFGMRGPGAPPGPPPPRFGCGPPPGPPPPRVVTLPPPPPKRQDSEIIIIGDIPTNNAKPPAYSEARPGSGLAGPVPPILNANTTKPLPAEKVPPSMYPDEKAIAKAKDEPVKTEEVVKPTIPKGRLFKAPANGLGFKLKSFFRSKESLAAEMRRTLSDSESHLMAYVIQKHDLRQVPHSAFHSLEATHIKTILSQLNGSEWYKTFSSLDNIEHNSIHHLLNPWVAGKKYERELVVLKVLEQNRLNAWMVLLGELLKNRPFPRVGNSRVLLAIVREKFVDGKPVKDVHARSGPPPPPPPPFPPPPHMPSIRPPPPITHCLSRRTTVSDLNGPPPPSNWPAPNGPPGFPPGPPRGPPGPPPRPVSNFPNGPPGPPLRNSSIRNFDITPVTDVDAFEVLTTFNEYTMRLAGKPDDAVPRTWSRVAVTQENSEKHLLQHRIRHFVGRGVNIIEVKMRLTELQSDQVTRLMDDLKMSERDSRFEWTWAELSLYNDTGDITTELHGGGNGRAHDRHMAGSATRMHLIAKRTLKVHLKPLDVYNALNRPPPRPPVQPTIIEMGPPRPPPRKGRYASSSSSDSGSERSLYSSDSSVGNVRRHLRRYRSRKMRRGGKGRRFYNDSDSDSDDSEDEDVIAVKLTLKRGDDLVKVLLERWTPGGEVEGKGKGKMLSTNF